MGYQRNSRFKGLFSQCIIIRLEAWKEFVSRHPARGRSPCTPPAPRKESFHAMYAKDSFHATGAVEGVLSRHRRRARKSFHANRAVKGSLPRLAPRKKSFNSPVHRGKIPPCRGYTERAAPVHRLSRRVTGVSFSPQARLHYFVRPY